MKRIFFLLTLILVTACNERIVELPETTNNDITEVNDVSSIYLFYNEDTGEAEFNRKNMISSTNWLVAVDKRLTIDQTLSHLQFLYEKRHGGGMHSNDKAKNYFACSNTNTKELAFIDFTNVVYKEEDMGKVMLNFFENKANIDTQHHAYVNVRSLDSIVIGNQMSINTFDKNKALAALKAQTNNNSIQYNFYLSFNKALSFNDYIAIKTLFLELEQDNVSISKEEFVYSL